MSEPQTEAGRRLHARIFGLSDRMPDGAELDNLILAIEAEARAASVDPRTVMRRDGSWVAVRDHPDVKDAVEAFEVPEWVVKAIYARASKDPDEEARKIDAALERMRAERRAASPKGEPASAQAVAPGNAEADREETRE